MPNQELKTKQRNEIKVQQKNCYKKVVVEQGMRVEKHHYLLERVAHGPKGTVYKIKKLIKK